MLEYTPYTYLIGWTKLNTWYYGSRCSRVQRCLYEFGCHPDELWKTYFTSSVHVKEFRKKHGEPDVIQIRRRFSSADDCLKWEAKVITRLKLCANPKWLNRGAGGFYVTTKPKSDAHKAKLSAWQKGIVRGRPSEETIKKISDATKGKKRSLTTRQRISKAQLGKVRGPCSIDRAKSISDGWKKRPMITCPHCGTSSICSGSMARWHFDNCKQK